MLLDGNCCWTAIADSLFQIELPNGTEKPAHFATQLARLLVVAMTTIVASMAVHTVDNMPGSLMIALAESSRYKLFNHKENIQSKDNYILICNNNDNNATKEVSNTISSVYVMTIIYCFRHSDWWRQSSFARRLIFGKRRLFKKIRRLGQYRG